MFQDITVDNEIGLASNRIGERRLLETVRKYGRPRVDSAAVAPG